MEEDILNFVAITSCDPDKAAQYLRLTENNLEQAIQLFFDSPNLDLGPSGGPSTQNAPTAPYTPHDQSSRAREPITIDSDEEMSDYNPGSGIQDDQPGRHSAVEDDEAMARRLQEEMYGNMPAEEQVRAPLSRTTETLVGPGSNWTAPDDDEINALVSEQLAARRRPNRGMCYLLIS